MYNLCFILCILTLLSIHLDLTNLLYSKYGIILLIQMNEPDHHHCRRQVTKVSEG